MTAIRDTDAVASSVAISVSTATDTELVAAVTGKRIAVWGYDYIVDGVQTVRFESGAGGTALTGVYSYTAAGQGIVVPIGRKPIFTTASGESLSLETGAAVQLSGRLTYSIVD